MQVSRRIQSGLIEPMNAPPLILASASPRRSQLLHDITPRFEVIPSKVEEIHNEQFTAAELSQVNAYRKARSVSKRFPDAVILGVDTLVTMGGRIFGKPLTHGEAASFLMQLQGNTHEVVSGVCLIFLRGHKQLIFAERTFVTFKKLSEREIKNYLSLINPLDKAGGYAIQEHGHQIVAQTRGSYSNVVGLPLEKLKTALEGFLLPQTS